MVTGYISKPVQRRRLATMRLWDLPGKTFTVYRHGWQTPNGHVRSIERGTSKPRWVAMTLDSDCSPDSMVRYRSEVFETRKEALAHVEAHKTRKQAQKGWDIWAGYVVATAVVRKSKTTISPVAYTLATPEKIDG
jgi:hypothetical protein